MLAPCENLDQMDVRDVKHDPLGFGLKTCSAFKLSGCLILFLNRPRLIRNKKMIDVIFGQRARHVQIGQIGNVAAWYSNTCSHITIWANWTQYQSTDPKSKPDVRERSLLEYYVECADYTFEWPQCSCWESNTCVQMDSTSSQIVTRIVDCDSIKNHAVTWLARRTLTLHVNGWQARAVIIIPESDSENAYKNAIKT